VEIKINKGGQAMKHGRKLTRSEKILLKKAEHDPENYLRVKRLASDKLFINRNTGETLPISY
jgi:hypothetical protein